MRSLRAVACLALCCLVASGATASDAMDRWAFDAGSRIARYIRPPSEARLLRSPRVVRVRFVVDARGRVRDTEILDGTGYRGIDQAALAAVLAASPLPAPPIRRGGDTILATLPISFNPSGIHVRPSPAVARD